MQLEPRNFREVWLLDFEFSAPSGERPQPVCLLAWELHSGRKLRVWQDELMALEAPPYALDKDVLLVAYYASAAQQAMADASSAVLGGMRLGSDAKIVRYPDRYQDGRGEKMWTTVWTILKRLGIGDLCNLCANASSIGSS